MGDERQLAFARGMRREPSVTERLMWKLLRHRRLDGMKFRRQVPLGRYIADFVCMRHRLIVEADGPFHEPERDAVRDAWLRSRGFRVLRFTNEEIDRAPGRVLAKVEAAVAAPILPSRFAGESVDEVDG